MGRATRDAILAGCCRYLGGDKHSLKGFEGRRVSGQRHGGTGGWMRLVNSAHGGEIRPTPCLSLPSPVELPPMHAVIFESGFAPCLASCFCPCALGHSSQ
jgi:hypothetical protein